MLYNVLSSPHETTDQSDINMNLLYDIPSNFQGYRTMLVSTIKSTKQKFSNLDPNMILTIVIDFYLKWLKMRSKNKFSGVIIIIIRKMAVKGFSFLL